MATKEPKIEDTMFQPIAFWSDVIKTLDNRIKIIAQAQRFGETGVNIIVKHGKVVDVIFKEEVRIRQDVKDDKQTQKNTNK